jgi:hypothetical protein
VIAITPEMEEPSSGAPAGHAANRQLPPQFAVRHQAANISEVEEGSSGARLAE